ncbi:probable cyclin-dependent serine/threonine-protein kinase DDB_G0292550 [Eurosta solidaginis]|uniref:probable cyclin-dependent serine/threonine-protein kinase DDB_G0292550 n=1 Tax=Eurosta solidaginis TaxID=178769 RepID=UPI0035313767
MRSPYDDVSVVTGNGEDFKANSLSNYNNNNNSAIPYHARENSLPFSYGQINNKTSTPLRSVNANPAPGGRYRNQRDIDFDGGGYGTMTTRVGTMPTKADINVDVNRNQHYSGTNYDTKYAYNNNTNGLTATLKSTTVPVTGSSTDKTNTNTTIKAQPRLTSPILVRKTLNSRSPTRNNGSTNTNTIANTYHYKYGSDNDSLFRGADGSRSGIGRDNTLNGNISGYNNNNNGYGSTTRKYNNNNMYFSGFDVGDTIDGSAVERKTQPRDDFEELLRERREKVMREHYRTPGSTVPTTATNGKSPNSRKFNYDFEFHLNLDDEAPPQPPRRAHNMDRTSPLQQQQQQYITREIPVEREVVNITPTGTNAATTYVERNYHTISTQQQPQPRQQQYESLYSTVEKRTIKPSQRRQYSPSLTPSPTQQLQPQHQQQQQRRLEYATYGNGNASGYDYGFDSSSNNEYVTTTNNNRSSLGAAVVARSRNDLSTTQQQPIYATTNKQQQQQHQINTTSTAYAVNRNTFEPELSITDYATTSALSLPIGPTPNVASTVGTGKISPLPSPYIARPETPAFPVTPRTPHAAYSGGGGKNSPMGSVGGYSHSPLPSQRRTPTMDLPNGKSMLDLHNYSSETIYRTSCRPRLDSNMSLVNSEPQEVAAHLVKFAKDSSKYWYKPNLSREEAVQLLLHAEPGTFIVRNSTTYKDNYGLVMRVHQPPPNSELTGQPDDLVRHFLIEPTKHGVRLKSCANEPVFTSLSALIYEHSINKLALPCLLRIPDHDLVPSLIEPTSAQKQLLTQGAACNVVWLFSSDTESLTGVEAIRKAIRQLYAQQPLPVPTEVHFKVTQQGITLTDNTRKKFFRKHYPADSISFCAIDPDHRLWSMQLTTTAEDEVKNTKATSSTVGGLKKTIFAFVARNSPKSKDNQCHVFCDLDIHQPASAIVSFVNKTLPTERERNFVL